MLPFVQGCSSTTSLEKTLEKRAEQSKEFIYQENQASEQPKDRNHKEGGEDNAHNGEAKIESTVHELSPEELSPSFEGGIDSSSGKCHVDASTPEQPSPETPDQTMTEFSKKTTFHFKGRVFDFVSNKSPLIEGVKICILNQPKIACETSDKGGRFVFHDLPLNVDLYFTFKDDAKKLVPLMVPLNVPLSSLDGNGYLNHRVGLITLTIAKGLAVVMGVRNLDLTGKTQIVADLHDKRLDPIQGATVSVSPKTGQGPYYLTGSGTKNPGGVTSVPGMAIFFNVDPGKTLLVNYKHPCRKCQAFPTSVRNTKGTASKIKTFKGWLIVTSGICH